MNEALNVTMRVQGMSLEITNQQEFALALKTWRLRNALTQEDAGRRFGCSRYTFIRAEAGKKLSWETTYKLFARLAAELEKEKSHENIR